MPLANQVVYIATWNEAAKTGKVYSYTIDPSSGAISKASERVTEGYGKVKDMSYKWSL
jgi:6-phosphogluconolactonase (cycloisomerase 2 family)